MHPTTIGLDLAKNIFQVHGVADNGTVVFNRSLRRAQLLKFFRSQPPCLVGMEACATSHYWARELTALGHEVRLMPPSYVKPYVKRGKSDAADAEAICEAVTRPSMRTVRSRQQINRRCFANIVQGNCWLVREHRFPMLFADCLVSSVR